MSFHRSNRGTAHPSASGSSLHSWHPDYIHPAVLRNIQDCDSHNHPENNCPYIRSLFYGHCSASDRQYRFPHNQKGWPQTGNWLPPHWEHHNNSVRQTECILCFRLHLYNGCPADNGSVHGRSPDNPRFLLRILYLSAHKSYSLISRNIRRNKHPSWLLTVHPLYIPQLPGSEDSDKKDEVPHPDIFQTHICSILP